MKYAATSATENDDTVLSRSVGKQAYIIKSSNCYYVKHAVKSDTEDARHEFKRKVGKQVYIIKGSNC